MHNLVHTIVYHYQQGKLNCIENIAQPITSATEVKVGNLYSSLKSTSNMADHTPNFSCSDPDINHELATDYVWKIKVEGPHHQPSIVALAVIQLIYVLIGVPWNAIVFTVILIKRLFKEPTYILLLNMIFADLLVLLILPFNISSAIPKEFLIGDSDFARCQACHAIVITTIILTNVSLFSLALLSVERLIYIKWPFIYQNIISIKSVVLILAVTWLICIVISLPPVFGFGEIKFANPIGSCSLILTGRNRVSLNIIYTMVLLVVLSVPLVATFVADIWLLVIVCKGLRTRYTRTRESTRNAPNQSHMERKNSEAKVKGGYQIKQLRLVQVFGIIFAANIITWIPTIFISLISLIIGANNISIWWFSFVYIIYVSQPAIHPMLETCLLGKARRIIFKVLCCCKNKSKRHILVTKSSNIQLPSTTEM